MLGATPVVIATKPEDGFRLRAQDLEDAITPRTRWLLINSPSNPSGAVYEHQHYTPVLDVVARHPQVWLIADDIYEHPGVLGVGQVRLRWIGHQLRAECEVTVDAGASAVAAHQVAVRAEHALLHAVPRLTAALVHADPQPQGGADYHAELASHR